MTPSRWPLTPALALLACGGPTSTLGSEWARLSKDRAPSLTATSTVPAEAPMPPPFPPKEAVDACTGRQAGDQCSFTFDGRHLDGACRAGPPGAPAACAPDGSPPPLPIPPKEAVEACAGRQVGDACAFSLDGREVRGSCRGGPPGAPPACAPAQGS